MKVERLLVLRPVVMLGMVPWFSEISTMKTEDLPKSSWRRSPTNCGPTLI
jgi:hypothetical protein